MKDIKSEEFDEEDIKLNEELNSNEELSKEEIDKSRRSWIVLTWLKFWEMIFWIWEGFIGLF